MSSFKFDRSFERKFCQSTDAQKVVLKAAEPAVPKAKQLAPEDTGDLRRGIGIEPVDINGKAGARLLSRDWKTAIIMAGNSRVRPNPFLRKAVEALGFKIEKTQ